MSKSLASQFPPNFIPKNNIPYGTPTYMVTSPGQPTQDYSLNSQFYPKSTPNNISSSQYIPEYKAPQTSVPREVP